MNSISMGRRLRERSVRSNRNLDRGNSRVARWLNKVQAGMDAVVNDLLTVDLVFIFQILVKSRLNVLYNWSPTRGVSEKKRQLGGGK